jgi:phosphatidate cytidylyltransferase
MLKSRIITSFIALPIVLAAVWFSRQEFVFPAFTLLAAVAGFLAAVEFYRLCGVAKDRPLFILGLALIILFIISPHFNFGLKIPVTSLLLLASVILPLIVLLFLKEKDGVFSHWAWTLGGILYLGWLMNLIVSLRLDAGRNWIYLAFLATFGSDTSAYFIGRAFGKHKMAPRISPGKTWEGAVAGIIGAVIVSLLFLLDTPFRLYIAWEHTVALGLVIGVFGILGDLTESLLKRNFNVKDSGNLMPGHGGLLDRIDSLLFAGAVVYLYYYLFII